MKKILSLYDNLVSDYAILYNQMGVKYENEKDKKKSVDIDRSKLRILHQKFLKQDIHNYAQ